MTISSVKTGAIGDSLLAGNAAFNPSSYESIATATPSGSSSVTFSSIPSTYQHLQIRVNVINASVTQYLIRPNNDTTNGNYACHTLYGDGSSAGAGGSTASNPIIACNLSNPSTSSPQTMIIDIQDYASTTKFKTIRVLTGNDRNGAGGIELNSVLWRSTSAITSLVFPNANSVNYNSGSVFSLYGIKGA
jgi:hypothetical protein